MIRQIQVAVLAVAMLVVSGCASRGFVRNEVGASADVLRAQIEDNSEQVQQAQDGIAALETESADQAERLSDTNEALESASQTAQEGLDANRAEIAEVRSLAGDALESGENANERVGLLEQLFGDRNKFDIRASREFSFGFDSAELNMPEGQSLDEIRLAMEGEPDAIIVLEGRTDSLGDEAYNLALAEKRIDAVRRHLVIELGVPFYRIHAFGFGEASPLFPNDDLENRAKNRVVTLAVLSPSSGLSD
jgi:outer membrane protein OmpA-like peptidoglycan-associated protein